MAVLKKLWFPFALLLIFGLAYFIALQREPLNSTIKIEVAPQDAKIVVDNRKTRSGDIKVPAGTHNIVVKKSGFKDAYRTITTEVDQSAYAGFVLESNSEETADWYEINFDDAKIAEGIGSHASDYDTQQAIDNNSLLQVLPETYGDGHGGLVTIDSGVPLENSSQPAIYVTAETPGDRQGVLTWLRSRGYNPASMDIVFYSERWGFAPQEAD